MKFRWLGLEGRIGPGLPGARCARLSRVRDTGAARPWWRRSAARAASGRPPRVPPHRVRIVRKHDLPSLHPLPWHTNNTHRCSPVEGLDYGGPAVL